MLNQKKAPEAAYQRSTGLLSKKHNLSNTHVTVLKQSMCSFIKVLCSLGVRPPAAFSGSEMCHFKIIVFF